MTSMEQHILASALGAGFFAGIIALWKFILFPNAEYLIEKHSNKNPKDGDKKDPDESKK